MKHAGTNTNFTSENDNAEIKHSQSINEAKEYIFEDSELSPELKTDSKNSNNKKRIFSRKIIPSIFISIFCLIIFTVGFVAAVMPKQTVSYREKRILEPMPDFSFKSLFSGEYTECFDKFYSDTFPLRNAITDFATQLKAYRGLQGEDEVSIYGDGVKDDTGTDEYDPTELKKANIADSFRNKHAIIDSEEYPTPDEPVTIGKKSEDKPEEKKEEDKNGGKDIENPLEGEEGNYVNNIFVIGNTAFEIFGRNDTAGKEYAEIINKWRAKIPDTVNIYNLIVPKNSAISLPEKYSSKNGDQEAGIEYIYSQLSEGVTPVRIFSTLYSHRNEYLYFRTDHHWTQRGAYYAYREFIKAAGFEPKNESDFTINKFEGYLGTLYNATKDAKLKNDPDYVEAWYANDIKFSMTYYTAKEDKSTGKMNVTKFNRSYIIRSKATSKANSYGVFIDGDNALTVITNNGATSNGRKIVVVKESYGNCFVPFLANHFDTVYVVDQRYYNRLVTAGEVPKLAKFIEQEGVTDVLFINNMQAAIGGLKNYIEKLL